jgi:site-specific DNA-methyltransferase (adenine-specific)
MNPKDRKAKTEMKPKPKTPNLPAATPAHAPALEWWPVDRPVPYARNPRRNDGAVDALAASIREFGFRSPVLVDAAGVVIAGHTRLKAARKLGLREVPVLVCADLPPEKVAALRLADNKTAELAEWDTPALDAELAELAEAGVDMEPFGFGDELAALAGTEGQTDEDAVPEPPPEPVSRRGAVYALGRHRLMCGDSTSAEDVAKLMHGEKADMVFTDPPYGMKLDVSISDRIIPKGKWVPSAKRYKAIKGDNADFSPALISTVFENFSYCPEVFLWGGDYYCEEIPERKNGSWFVWDKRYKVEHVKYSISEFELCWSRKRHAREIVRVSWFGVCGIEQEPDKQRNHPTQKPVLLSRWFVEKFTKEGDIVADIYLGSGSTLLACEKTGRVCYGMELEPHYCDVIRKRWAEFVHGEGCDWQTLAPEVAE